MQSHSSMVKSHISMAKSHMLVFVNPKKVGMCLRIQDVLDDMVLSMSGFPAFFWSPGPRLVVIDHQVLELHEAWKGPGTMGWKFKKKWDDQRLLLLKSMRKIFHRMGFPWISHPISTFWSWQNFFSNGILLDYSRKQGVTLRIQFLLMFKYTIITPNIYILKVSSTKWHSNILTYFNIF